MAGKKKQIGITITQAEYDKLKAAKRSLKKPKSKMAMSLRTLGKYVGKTTGGYFGSQHTGSKYGKYLGAAVSKIMGHGSYSLNSRIKKNSILTNPQVPFLHSSQDGFRIRHREYIADVYGSISFNTTSISVNPGLSSSFPWLSQLAPSFEQYKFDGLVFEFVSTCGEALSSTNNALGQIVISSDYNVVNGQFNSLLECNNSMWAVSGKPSENLMMPIECDVNMNPMSQLYIRNAPIGTSQNLQFYDLCNLQVSTQGQQQDNVNLGSLWCSFDVCFYKSIISNSSVDSIGTAHYGSATYTNANPLAGCIVVMDKIGLTITNNTIVFPKFASGIYNFNLYWRGGAGATIVTPAVTFTANVTPLPLYDNDNYYYYNNSGIVGATIGYQQFFVTVSNDGNLPIITFGTGTLPTSGVSGVTLDLIISQCDNGLE